MILANIKWCVRVYTLCCGGSRAAGDVGGCSGVGSGGAVKPQNGMPLQITIQEYCENWFSNLIFFFAVAAEGNDAETLI